MGEHVNLVIALSSHEFPMLLGIDLVLIYEICIYIQGPEPTWRSTNIGNVSMQYYPIILNQIVQDELQGLVLRIAYLKQIILQLFPTSYSLISLVVSVSPLFFVETLFQHCIDNASCAMCTAFTSSCNHQKDTAVAIEMSVIPLQALAFWCSKPENT